jgi:hypothetical protein
MNRRCIVAAQLREQRRAENDAPIGVDDQPKWSFGIKRWYPHPANG